MPEDAQPEVGGALRAGGTRLGEGVSLSPGGGGGVHVPPPGAPLHRSPLLSHLPQEGGGYIFRGGDDN